jgi:hypothetical protein
MLPVPPPNRREGGGKPVWHAGQGPCRHAGHHQQAQQSDPDIVLKSGEQRTVGNVVVKLAACCEKTAPGAPQRVGAFVQVFVQERSSVSDRWSGTRCSRAGSSSSPSLNVVEHPVYDVGQGLRDEVSGRGRNPDDFKAAAKAPKPRAATKPRLCPRPGVAIGNEADGGDAPPTN